MLFLRRCNPITTQATSKIIKFRSSSSKPESINNDEDFQALELMPKKKRDFKHITRNIMVPRSQPRADTMPLDQDWQVIWPSARTFHPGTVPLPIRQGFKHKKKPHPSKYQTTELMKIPNFLHLTPPVIKKHCEALKKFCTEWPSELKTNEACVEHFPLEIISSTYCYSAPSIREPLARIVSLQVKLSSLHLDAHAKDKMLRLVGDRYNPETNQITITSDRCPTRKQNLDYLHYLLTALFHVSWRIEPWEKEKSKADMEYYDWDESKSRNTLVTMHCWPQPPTDFNYEHIPHVTEYKAAVSNLFAIGENESTMDQYKNAVLNLLNLEHNESM